MKKILFTFLFCLMFVSPSWAKIKVVATTGQVADAVRNVAGDLVELESLMESGVDPHLYRATEGDVRKLHEADIIFYNGLYLEAKLEDILEKMSKNKKVVAVTEELSRDDLLDSDTYDNHFDPHVWFDITLWMQTVEKVQAELSAIDPENAEEFRSNTQRFLKLLEGLHDDSINKINVLPPKQRVLVTAHDAFRYFGRTYQFEVVGLQGLSTEAEAGTKDIMELADFIVKRKIPAIFIESSVPERNIRAVQEAVRARNWDVYIGGELFSDSMGEEGTFLGTYIGMFTYNVETIVDGLKVRAPIREEFHE